VSEAQPISGMPESDSGSNLPKIDIDPIKLAFDSQLSNWEKIDIGVYKPKEDILYLNTIDIIVPDGWDIKSDPNANSPYYYDSKQRKFWVTDNFDMTNLNIPLLIKPAPSTKPGIYELEFIFVMEYYRENSRIYEVSQTECTKLILESADGGIIKYIKRNIWIIIGTLIALIALLYNILYRDRKIREQKR